MTHRFRTSRSLLVGGWVLLMPPVPLGTSLPPLDQWRPMAAFPSSAACEAARSGVKDEARVTVARDPNASALAVAAALGRLQARCAQTPDRPAVKEQAADATQPAAASR